MTDDLTRLEELFHRLSSADSNTRAAELLELGERDPELKARLVALLEAEKVLEADELSDLLAQELSSGPTRRFEDQQTITSDQRETLVMSGDEEESSAADAPSLPGFHLVRKLGEGGMGVVWQAQQLEPVRRRVAVKLIRAQRAKSREMLARFRAEQQALALMEHPNIARVFESGVAPDGSPFFVMELVTGLPITAYCDRRSQGTEQRLRLFRQVCAAVAHAHRRGVLHRDLKPSNILVHEVDGEAIVKVIDFGISKIIEGEEPAELETRQGDVVGTPAYMSPEQLDADVSAVDTRTDVYSLGVVLFELLVGSLPHGAGVGSLKELLALRDRVVSGETPSPSSRLTTSSGDSAQIAKQRSTEVEELLRELRGELDWIVLKALARETEERYESPAALSRDIERYLLDLPVEAGPPHLRYRLRKFIQRHRVATAAAALVTFAILVGIAGLGIGLTEARAARTVAETRAEEAEASRDFLVSLFEIADDSAARAGELSAVDLLERGGQRLELGLGGQPQQRATLLSVLAGAYRRLGEYARARDTAHRAVETWTDLGSAETSNAARRQWVGLSEAELESARADLAAGRLADARATLEKLIDRLRSSDSFEGSTITDLRLGLEAHAEIELAEVSRLEGDLPGALARAQRGLELAERSFGPAHPQLAWVLGRAGMFEAANHDAEAALSKWRRALEISSRHHGEEAIENASHLNNIATLLRVRGRAGEAEPLLRRLVDIDRARYGLAHPLLARTLYLHGESMRQLGRADEASAALTEALSIQRRSLGTHPGTALTLTELGLSAFDQERPEIAVGLLREAVEMQRSVFGDSDPRVAKAASDLADVERATGQLAQAEASGRLAVEIARRSLPQNDPRTALYLLGLSDTRRQSGSLDDARQLHQRAASILESELDEAHLFRILADLQEAEIELASGAAARAVQLLAPLEQRLAAADAGSASKAAIGERLRLARDQATESEGDQR